jgi:putative GTP pyrophosphokinase
MPINQTANVTNALVEAYGIATEKRNDFLTPEHLLAGFLKDKDFWEAYTRCGRAQELEDDIYSYLNDLDSIPEDLEIKIDFSEQLQELFDIAGIRVICSFIDDIYVLADCLLQQDDVTLIERKDYIENPKGNGYRSLHLVVEVPIFLQNEKRLMKVEVQLRTIAMDFWANLEHKLRYKKDLSDDVLALTAAELSECAETSALLDRKMQRVRDIIEGEISLPD